jgi:hypothetical protein
MGYFIGAIVLVSNGCGQSERIPEPVSSQVERLENSRAVIEVEHTIRDLGTFRRPWNTDSVERELDVEFPIKNSGHDPLIIRELVADCACMKLDLKRRTIPPGEQETLKVRVRLFGSSSRTSATVQVVTNDENKPTVGLRILWKVLEFIELEPSAIALSDVHGELKGTIKVLLNAESKSLPAIKSVYCTTPNLSAKWIPSKQAPAPVGEDPTAVLGEIHVFGKRWDDEPGHAEIVVQLRNLEKDFRTVINWPSVKGLRISPRSVYLGICVPAEKKVVRFIVVNDFQDGTKLVKVRAGTVIEASLKEHRETNAEVELTLPHRAGAFKDQLELQFEGSQTKSIPVVITGIITDGAKP